MLTLLKKCCCWLPSRKLTYPADKAYLKMIFLSPVGYVIVPWRVFASPPRSWWMPWSLASSIVYLPWQTSWRRVSWSSRRSWSLRQEKRFGDEKEVAWNLLLQGGATKKKKEPKTWSCFTRVVTPFWPFNRGPITPFISCLVKILNTKKPRGQVSTEIWKDKLPGGMSKWGFSRQKSCQVLQLRAEWVGSSVVENGCVWEVEFRGVLYMLQDLEI